MILVSIPLVSTASVIETLNAMTVCRPLLLEVHQPKSMNSEAVSVNTSISDPLTDTAEELSFSILSCFVDQKNESPAQIGADGIKEHSF